MNRSCSEPDFHIKLTQQVVNSANICCCYTIALLRNWLVNCYTIESLHNWIVTQLLSFLQEVGRWSTITFSCTHANYHSPNYHSPIIIALVSKERVIQHAVAMQHDHWVTQRRWDKVMCTKYPIVELAKESLPSDHLWWIEAVPSLIPT